MDISISKESYLFIWWYLLVHYKNKFKLINQKQLWDWMEYFKVCDRPHLNVSNLNKLYFSYWFSIYQYFDEYTSNYDTYLSWFHSDYIEEMNELLFSYWIDNRIYKKWNRIFFDNNLGFDDIVCDIDNSISNDNIVEIFSFVLWLIWAYWDMNIVDEWINSCKIHLKMELSLLWKDDFIEKLFSYLESKCLNIKLSYNRSKSWFVYQISIKDWEFIDFIINVSSIELFKNNLAKNYKDNLLNSLHNNSNYLWFDWEELINLLNWKTVKVLKK